MIKGSEQVVKNMVPISFDCDLTVSAYWSKHKKHLARLRHWTPETEKNYDKMMTKLTSELPPRSISEVTVWELESAVDRARNKKDRGGKYKSVQKFYSILGDIFRYAEAHGHACNVLAPLLRKQTEKAREKTLYEQVLDPELTSAERLDLLEQLLTENPYHPRSLSREVLYRLGTRLSKLILEDGRYCALAIMLYCGTRPSECRALRWGDLVPFRDHPQRRMLILSKTADSKGDIRERMKTSNAYRRVPVHWELMELLERRYAYEQAQLPPGEDMSELPICCFQNQFDRPCREYELSKLGREVLEKSGLTREDYAFYYADTILHPDGDKKGESNVHLYILRRNFYSWLQGLTQLSLMERSYLMGHSMVTESQDLRPTYNSEDVLYRMLEMMDRAVLNPDQLRPPYIQTLRPEMPIHISNQGTMIFSIPPDNLTSSCEIGLSLLAGEPGSRIIVSARSPVRPFGKILVVGEAIPHPVSENVLPIGMGTYNLYAWNRFNQERPLDTLSWEKLMELFLKGI